MKNIDIYFMIPGNPIAQPRHKISKWGGKYLEKTSKGEPHPVIAWKEKISAEAKRQYRGEITTAPVVMDLLMYMKHPKSLKKKHFKKSCIPHIKRPDRDNIEKAVQDAITNIWKDDSQVFDGRNKKCYDVNLPDGCLVVKIMILNEF